MNPPKISIVIPSYNKVRYIAETLESIFKQNYKNIEVIIQDGGSNDGSLEIIKKYIKKYPSLIKFESKKDNGQLDAINKGMHKATGDILAFINADDVYEAGVFETVASYFIENPSSLWFVGKAKVINASGRETATWVTWYKNILLKINSYKLLLMTNYLMQPSVFISKEAFKQYGSFTGTKDFVTEYEMWLKLGKMEMPIIINKFLSRFRIEANTMTKKIGNQLLIEDEKIVKKYTSNILILSLHYLHNIGRRITARFI